jgi:cytochrome P450
MTTADQDRRQAGCPVEDYTFGGDVRPALHYFARLDGYQDRARPFLRTEDAQATGVFTDHDAILEGLQHPELFSSRVMVPVEPDPPYKWIPIMLDPPEHTKWRRVLGAYFSPGRVERLKDDQRQFARDLVASFRDRGQCDFYAGSHLARQEMVVALEEWHKAIPDYRVADVVEHSGGVFSLESLPLRWST